LRKDGCMFWAHVVITALKNQKGELYGYTKITRDITEQKNLREQITHLANIVDQSSEAIISIGLDSRLISWNKGAEELFGFTKEEAIGKTTMDLKFIQSPAEEIKEFEQQINEKGFWKAEKPLYHKNGHSFTGQISANAVKNEHGEITSIVSVIKDISVSKLVEKTLKETNFELEEKILERTKEIKKSELKYLLLFEDNPLPICE
jgi:PAS domain S-box-containing protein